jgi:Chloramphenicol O-acetyltransferase
MGQPHFNICANVDITALLDLMKKENLPFMVTMVYLVSRSANVIPEFRQRIRGAQVVEHELVHPSYAVTTDETDVFSFCYTNFQKDYQDFKADAFKQIEKMKTDPSFEDEEGRDDFLFLSTLPWVSFTSIQHAMHCPAIDSVPRITWGKYFKEGDRIKMPLAVQAHHALVDGSKTGYYFKHFQDLANEDTWLS